MFTMKNAVTVIEISHRYLKILIGEYTSGKVIVLYSKKIKTDQLLENGAIKSKSELIDIIAKNNPINDEIYHINELIDNVILVLPPYGLEIYETSALTAVESREKIVSSHDIRTLFSIVSNKKLPVDNDLIDIIPEYYLTDTKDKYRVPPIGKSSRDIALYCSVYTLPKRINNDYSDVINSSGIKIAHKTVSTYAIKELLNTYPNMPKEFFLIDIGASSTSVSLVGANRLLATRSFAFGGDNITERIIECFNINEADAENIKRLYGYDLRKMEFAYPIIKNSLGKSFVREDLNNVIVNCLNSFVFSFETSSEKLANLYKAINYKDLPIYLVGGGSKLHGLVDYLKSKLNKDNIEVLRPNNIGARDPSLFACLGAVVVHSNHPGMLEEVNNASVNMSREE